MSGNFFDRLELELSGLVHEGRHLSPARQHERRRTLLIRRMLVLGVLMIALAASLASEFPASATGRTAVTRIAFISGR